MICKPDTEVATARIMLNDETRICLEALRGKCETTFSIITADKKKTLMMAENIDGLESWIRCFGLANCSVQKSLNVVNSALADSIIKVVEDDKAMLVATPRPFVTAPNTASWVANEGDRNQRDNDDSLMPIAAAPLPPSRVDVEPMEPAQLQGFVSSSTYT